MITKDTHKIDWNKTAQVTGVVLLALAKAGWWMTKRIGIFLVAILTVLAKVFVALVSVWANLAPTPQEEEEERKLREKYDLSRAPDPDEPGFDILGRPINIHKDYL